ncbi:uncharacterized protein LOC6583691 [Drosophila mojavensis]|uniref:Uncharacterized protein n=1 Tax=Drosophila mojavensis TaxID=7230 RepID=B4L1F2_DROMO|nr:uncharacterized protein LOC6583691 [Drosophila mojavensis]EDW06673.1 uncharacterized protein Dmoj_GI15305 [Drosophila mojavensis]
MPLGKKLAIGSEEARRQRAELRTSYGNKLSNMNLGRLRSRAHTSCSESNPFQNVVHPTSAAPPPTASLRRIASSFAHVSDVNSGSCAALPLEDSEDDAREELAEVLIRSEPFKMAPGLASKSHPLAGAVAGTNAEIGTRIGTGTGSMSAAAAGAAAANYARATRQPVEERRNHYLCANVMRSRASERWSQIAGTVSTLFRVRRISTADPLSELRRLREQRDLLEAFTRPFLYEDGIEHK